MAVKSKSKPNLKPKAAAGKKSKPKKAVAKSAIKKTVAKVKTPAAKKVAIVTTKSKSSGKSAKAVSAPVKKKSHEAEKPVEVTRFINLASQIRQPVKTVAKKQARGSGSAAPFNFMKAPRPEYAFDVGDNVEVYCDHEKGNERVRGWIKGIVVQVDNKMVAVQFRSNVFLTDGWMVPDRILWYPLNSEHIRPATTGKKPAVKKDIIPDY
ncbi:MAG: hypothetical protein H6635_01745 [Anaerolineales bacterium]|nr:hypothetical protein [Anaerolineales bacterium]MCB9144064.1 hypothetical protein [Anaerolineales bacterium]